MKLARRKEYIKEEVGIRKLQKQKRQCGGSEEEEEVHRGRSPGVWEGYKGHGTEEQNQAEENEEEDGKQFICQFSSRKHWEY